MALRFVSPVSFLLLSRILKKLLINCLEQLRVSYVHYRTSQHDVYDSRKICETNSYPGCAQPQVVAQCSPSRLISLSLSSVRCQETRL
jgi:hypothetical protein